MNWFTLTLINVAILTFVALLNKKSVNDNDVDGVVYGAVMQIISSLACFILALATGWQFTFDATSIPLLILVGITYAVGVSLYFTGLKKIDLSTTLILESTGAIYSLVLGFIFFAEGFTLAKILGVILIIAAVIVVSSQDKKAKFSKYSVIILVAIFFYAISAVLDKKLTQFGTPLTYLALSYGYTGALMLALNPKRTVSAFNESFRKKSFWIGVTTAGVLYAFGFWALFEAYNRGGEVSRMFPMLLSTSVFVPILGILFLKERENLAGKLLALPIMVAGLWLLGI